MNKITIIGLSLMGLSFIMTLLGISYDIYKIQNSVLEIKKILTTENFEYNNCYETEELNLIICKKGEK